MRMKNRIRALLAACLMLPLAVSAAVRYEFTAFNSFDFGGVYSGGFTLEVPGFIVPGAFGSPTSFAPTSLLSCNVFLDSAPTGTCGDQDFFKFDSRTEDVVGFGTGSGQTIFYYFAEGAFGTLGTWDTTVFGADQSGRLVVSGAPDNNNVPEPGTLALLGLSVAGLAAVRRRKR